MKPISSSVRVERPRDEVFAFLDVLANHPQFTDHMLVDWSFAGPREGVGSKSHMRPALPGPKDWMDLEVLESRAPETTVEETVSAKGKRRTRGTYTLEELPDGGTHVRFELVWLRATLLDRMLAPISRGWLQRGNDKAMQRLGETLQ
jgi:Polyketide cyclase / dehydrase and lipid transport